MIYARINDFGEKVTNDRRIMFEKDMNDNMILKVKLEECVNLDRSYIDKIKFNDIFDDKFKDNITISKYLTISSQLTKKKGVVFLTYGYSGTGKTFTLFGNSSGNTGLLQSTLQNVRGIDKIYFRVYEIYGKGVNYNDYWDDKINQELYAYKLNIIDNKIILDNPKKVLEIKDYIDSSEDLLEINNFEEVFKTFNEFVDVLDKIRIKNKRIISTPNNPQSSRSIIVYEFLNKIENELIPFILIDLPGREEIIDSYYDPIVKKLDLSINTDLNRAILSSSLINPLYLSLLIPSDILKEINELNKDDREFILQDILDEIIIEDINNKSYKIKELYPMILDNVESKFIFKDNKLYIIKEDTVTGKISCRNIMKYIECTKDSINIEVLISFIMIKRLILMKRLDLLETIIKKIIKDRLKLDDFTYITNALEGIYINENITALIKILLDTLDTLDMQELNKSIIKSQSNTLDINYQNLIVRDINLRLYEKIGEDNKGKSIIQEKDQKVTNPVVDIKRIKKIIKKDGDEVYTFYESMYEGIDNYNKTVYSSQNIFNISNPYIYPIISKYLVDSETIINNKQFKLLKTETFKLLYLMTNNNNKQKCENQYKLLTNTKLLIAAITKSN